MNRSSTKFRIHGNCQVSSIADSLRILYSSDEVRPYHVDTSPSGLGNHLEGLQNETQFVEIFHDSLLAVIHENPNFVDLLPSQYLTIPSITFTAFHPDIQYIFDSNGVVKNGLMGDWNSRIAIIAYLGDLTVEQTIELFNKKTFNTLGYFRDWNDSAKSLMTTFEACELDGTQWLRKMSSKGTFMHGINHPKPDAIFELVRQFALVHLSEPCNKIESADLYLTDHLSHIVWPVYPEIGSVLGLYGTYLWREGAQLADLNTFIKSTFQHWDYLDLKTKKLTFIPSLHQDLQSLTLQ